MRYVQLMTLLALCALIPQAWAADTYNPTRSTENHYSADPVERCGHMSEMLAARGALAAGDREGALQHLRNARALLLACDQQAARSAGVKPTRESLFF